MKALTGLLRSGVGARGFDAAVVVTVVHGCPLKITGGWKPLIQGCTAYSSL